MKLYYSPGSCSLASHIALLEGNIIPELVKVQHNRLEDGTDFYAINTKGAVPAIELSEGLILTEGAAVLQYIGDHYAPDLVPAHGTIDRARLQEILNYLSSEYHKSYIPLFLLADDADRGEAQAQVIKRLTYLDGVVARTGAYLLGDSLSVADLYLFVVTRWAAHFGIKLDALPALRAFMDRIQARPTVQAALEAEGLSETNEI